MVKVSVILPVFGYSKYLKSAIDSILSQTLKDIELIIVEDPKEGRYENEETIKSYNDKRIKYIKNKEREGIADSLNKGIKNAKSEYVAIQDADDISFTNRLALQYSLIKTQKNLAVVGGNMEIIDEEDNVIGKRYYPISEEKIKKKIVLKNVVGNPTVMFRKSCILQAGGYDKRWGYCMDYCLWLKILNKGLRITNINSFLVKYRYHKSSLKYKKFKDNLKDTINLQMYVLKEYKNLKVPFSFLIYLIAEVILLVLPKKIGYFLFEKFSTK